MSLKPTMPEKTIESRDLLAHTLRNILKKCKAPDSWGDLAATFLFNIAANPSQVKAMPLLLYENIESDDLSYGNNEPFGNLMQAHEDYIAQMNKKGGIDSKLIADNSAYEAICELRKQAVAAREPISRCIMFAGYYNENPRAFLEVMTAMHELVTRLNELTATERVKLHICKLRDQGIEESSANQIATDLHVTEAVVNKARRELLKIKPIDIYDKMSKADKDIALRIAKGMFGLNETDVMECTQTALIKFPPKELTAEQIYHNAACEEAGKAYKAAQDAAVEEYENIHEYISFDDSARQAGIAAGRAAFDAKLKELLPTPKKDNMPKSRPIPKHKTKV